MDEILASSIILLVLQMIELTSRYAFKVLHTPGHTMESVVYLLIDKLHDNKPLKVYSDLTYKSVCTEIRELISSIIDIASSPGSFQQCETLNGSRIIIVEMLIKASIIRIDTRGHYCLLLTISLICPILCNRSDNISVSVYIGVYWRHSVHRFCGSSWPDWITGSHCGGYGKAHVQHTADKDTHTTWWCTGRQWKHFSVCCDNIILCRITVQYEVFYYELQAFSGMNVSMIIP